MRIPFVNPFAVSCAVCLQWALTVNQSVPLASVRFEKKKLALKTSKSFIQLGEHKDFIRIGHLPVCTICEVFRVTPSLFGGDYFWHTKHDALPSGILLLQFEWAFPSGT